MSFSIIIPSKTIDNLIPCLGAIWRNEPGLKCEQVIVVDDGLKIDDNSASALAGVMVIQGVKPFVFARNINRGIAAAGDSDCILLNDDALLDTPFGFTGMWGMARNNSQYGLISASCNNVGNANQHRHLDSEGKIRDEPRMVCFVCVLVLRETINRIGGLDERFIAYGEDDTDFSRRAREAGLKIGIWDGVFVDHGSLKSSFRSDPTHPHNWQANRQIYFEKWGDLT